MRRYITALSLATLLCFSSLLAAQDTSSGETFTDFDAFEAEVCGTIAGDPFDNDNFLEGFSFEDPNFVQTIPGGQVETEAVVVLNTVPATCLIGGVSFGIDVSPAFIADPASGPVEGFCIEYTGSPVISIFDGSTLVDTITPPPTAILLDPSNASTICWLNTDLENVTSISFGGSADGNGGICGFQFAFGEQGCNDVETCRSLLQDVIGDVAAIAPVDGTYDQQFLDCAVGFLGCADHDSLWINDDQVANCDAFFFLYKATKCLSFVTSSPEVDQALADIQDVLSCLAETEIAAAEAAGGDSSLIACAEYYQSCADAYEEIGFLRKATVLRKLAWYKAVAAY